MQVATSPSAYYSPRFSGQRQNPSTRHSANQVQFGNFFKDFAHELRHPAYTAREKLAHVIVALAAFGSTVASTQGIRESMNAVGPGLSSTSKVVVCDKKPQKKVINGNKVILPKEAVMPKLSCPKGKEAALVDVTTDTPEKAHFDSLSSWDKTKYEADQVSPSYWLWLLSSLAAFLYFPIDVVMEMRENDTDHDKKRRNKNNDV